MGKIINRATPLSDGEKKIRDTLKDRYNTTKSKVKKRRAYEALMEFEEQMLREGKNG